MKAKLITETSYDIELYEKDDKNLYIVGIFSSADVKNANGRIYPRSLLEREVNKLMTTSIKNRTALGELGHPISPETSLERAAILTEHLEWNGNNVYGKARVLNTPHGKILKTLLKERVQVGISSRGLGTVSKDGIVEDSLQILVWDAVSSPSNPGSWVSGIYEGREFEIPGENINMITEEEKQKALDYKYKEIVSFLNSLK